MPRKLNVVQLSEDERLSLQKVSRSNRASVREKTRARVLLSSDFYCPREQGGSRRDGEIADELGCTPLTVSNIRKRACQRGVLESLRRGEQAKRRVRKLDGRQEAQLQEAQLQEAQLVAVTCSAPPEGRSQGRSQGRSRWSLRLLRERLIEMEVVEHIGLETIRTTLKKTRSSRS